MKKEEKAIEKWRKSSEENEKHEKRAMEIVWDLMKNEIIVQYNNITSIKDKY